MPTPIIEDWSFHYIGENYVLKHLFEKGPITSGPEYEALQALWNAEANRLGEVALGKRHDLFQNNPVGNDARPGRFLLDLGFISCEAGLNNIDERRPLHL